MPSFPYRVVDYCAVRVETASLVLIQTVIEAKCGRKAIKIVK